MRRPRPTLGDRWEFFLSWAEKIRLCRIQRRHQVKMDSHGCCYRCGRYVG